MVPAADKQAIPGFAALALIVKRADARRFEHRLESRGLA
jgi:hypothetical protein